MNRRDFLKASILPAGMMVFLEETQGPFKVICPECSKRGLRSKVYQGACETRIGSSLMWFDENGDPHISNPDGIKCQYECGNGHKFVL
jgi:hypothetical protein